MSTPIFDELEAKWSDEYYHRAICDQYWTVTHTATGQEWFEDDEGNEVFPEPDLDGGQYTVGAEEEALASQLRREALMEAGYKALASDPEYIREATVRKEGRKPNRKFKLFGRNQGTNGTL